MPNLDACVDMLGREIDPDGYDLGMIGLFGYPPAIAAEGLFQAHKLAWSPTTLGSALQSVGFDQVEQAPVSQTWRHAAKVGRDMRLVAVMGGAGAEATSLSGSVTTG
jgi:hypothetical protein